MFVKRLLSFLFLLPSLIAFSQDFATVKGTVKDSSGTAFDYVSVVVKEDQKYSTQSDETGQFSLKVPAGKKITIVFSSLNIYTVKQEITPKSGEVITLKVTPTARINAKDTVLITAERDRTVGQVEVTSVGTMTAGGPNEDISAALRFLGAQSNNELSTAYSVRGGNFDENLVYVNDFEVYRPFLIRSGQQEGLSFANPSMVSNIKFSTGGFQARYGDKLSSVLDVSYKKPKFEPNENPIHGSFYASLLGVGGELEGAFRGKHGRQFTFIVGVRQRLSQYVLKSLEEKGQYSPNFLDVQAFLTWQLDSAGKWGMELLSNYSRNQYVFKPVSRETSFGLLTDVKKLTVYFDGQEADKYQTLMNGLSLIYRPNNNLQFKWLGSFYFNREKEAYDILGEYYLSQVESDLGKDNFGEVLYSLGVGGLHNWARNTLNSDIYYAGHRGTWYKKGHSLQWGVDYKREVIDDKISQWNRLDSAGFSLPYNYTLGNYDTIYHLYPTIKDGLDVSPERLRTSLGLKSNRYTAFIQDTWKFGDSSRFVFNYGVRFQYWDVNKEIVVTPRAQFSYKPKGKADIVLTAAVGTYYQPPFYREMRDLDGKLNTSLKSQKSLHAVLGLNYAFKAWKRKFSFVTEAYYKHMWDLVPYEFDNVLIRYFGTNSAKGYAAGVDLRLNGELVEGEESWVSLGIMSTQEDIIGDKYTAYYDSNGTELAYNTHNAPKIVDSATIYPGYIPRPTDQRVNFSLFFQDHIPKFKFIKVSVALVFATGLPFGPPDHNRYKDNLRIPPYRRVDVGFSGQLWDPKWEKKKTRFGQGLRSIWLSLDVWNIFGITNTVSYLWVNDVYNNRYAVPNYLTSRRVNAKIAINF